MTVNVALQVGVTLRVRTGAVKPGTIRVATPTDGGRTLTAEDTPRDLIATVAFHFVPDGGLEVEIAEQPPFASGLGGSSVLAVALSRACLQLVGRRMSNSRLVAVLHDLEAATLGAPTGIQDYWPALTGGVSAIHLEPGGARVESLDVPLSWVADRLLVVHSGISHHSGMVNWDVYRARVDGDAAVARALDRIVEAATACRHALLACDAHAVAHALEAEWAARRQLAPAVSAPEIDHLIAAGLGAGALAAKACGAGGGGSVLFWLRPGCRDAVAEASRAACPGAIALSNGVAARGVALSWRREPA